jgi:hypothetical protein
MTVEDLENYYFIVAQDQTTKLLTIACQIIVKESRAKYAWTKTFTNEDIGNLGSVDAAKAITISELLENLNKE